MEDLPVTQRRSSNLRELFGLLLELLLELLLLEPLLGGIEEKVRVFLVYKLV